MNSTSPVSLRTSAGNPTQTQFCPFFALQTGLVKGKGPATICRKSLSLKVPETGLEPALPLQEPGPQPGASANSATPAALLHIRPQRGGIKPFSSTVHPLST